MAKSTAWIAARRWRAAAETSTIGSPAAFPRRGGDKHAHQVEASQRRVRQRVHAGQGQRLVVAQLERLHAVVAAHLADEACTTPPSPGWALVNGPTSRSGIERVGEQADVLHALSPR